MSRDKNIVVSNSGTKRRRFTPLQIGAVASLILVACCLCFLGVSLFNSNNATSTQVANLPAITLTGDISTPTQVVNLPATTPKSTESSTVYLPQIVLQSGTNEPDSSATSESVPAPLPTETTAPLDTPVPVTPTAVNPLRVHFVDVGQGDSILIQAPDGEAGLVDGGETDTGIVQYLQSQGINHLDFVLATHPHSDHIGGLAQVLQVIPVDIVYTNGVAHTTLTYEHFLDAIIDSGAEYVEVKRGDTISLGRLTFEVLNPVSNEDNDLNNSSIVLRMAYGEVSFLFTGDAQAAAESTMLASGLNLNATILKVAHHGSHSSSTPEFLAQVKPEVAIYSAGKGNDYGHPHPETIEGLLAVGAKIYGTDVNGTVVVTTNGSGYSVETIKQGQIQAPPIIQPTEEQPIVQPTAPPPTAQPTEVPPVKPTIDIVSLTSPIAPGGQASLTIKTTPGAACTITVYYKSGPSQAQGLGPQTANSEGNVTWSWKVGTRTTPGTWHVVVTADINGQTITQDIPFEVRK